MLSSNNDDPETPSLHMPILRSECLMASNGGEPSELNKQLENESTKGSSGDTAVVTPSSGKGESIDKTAAEGLLLAAGSELGGPHAQALEPDGPSPDFFTSQRKAAGLQPQSSADLQYAWLQEAAKTRLSPTDYICDSEFYPMYLYFTEGKLIGGNETDKKTLLLADQYVILDGLLYRMQLPKGKCSAADVAIVQRLCPQIISLVYSAFCPRLDGSFCPGKSICSYV